MSPEKLLASIMLVSLTLGAGLQVDRERLKAILKNVGLLGRALLANFVIVPILGVLIARLFALRPPIATGFLLMAIAPGVPFVLASVRKRGGRLGLAVELAVFLPLLSLITVPITAAWVLPAAAQTHLPLGRFVATLLLFQILPLLVGIAIAGRLPDLAARLARPAQILFFLSAIALLVVLFPAIVHDVASVYGSRGMWAALCLVLLSFGTGWLFGSPEREDRRVLAIGTALRNIGLAAVIAASSFKDPQVAATVIVYFIIQFIITTAAGAYFTRTAKGAAA
jgi:bile acid:Na+ symporter, BASS family